MTASKGLSIMKTKEGPLAMDDTKNVVKGRDKGITALDDTNKISTMRSNQQPLSMDDKSVI